MTTGFRCKVHDMYGLHNGFNLILQPGYTALVGPNGAGKTTMLGQIEEIAKSRGCDVFRYSNLTDGGETAKQKYMLTGDLNSLAQSALSSEGEQLAMNFEKAVKAIGACVRKAIETDSALFVLLDGLDSGASIDRLRSLMDFFELMERDAGVMPGGAEHGLYILAAVNAYELAKARCVDVRTGKSVTFGSYEDYSRFICNYLKRKD